MPSDASFPTLIAVHPVMAARTWRRLFWCGRVLVSLLARCHAGVPAGLRSEILYTSALVGSDALALSLSLPW